MRFKSRILNLYYATTLLVGAGCGGGVVDVDDGAGQATPTPPVTGTATPGVDPTGTPAVSPTPSPGADQDQDGVTVAGGDCDDLSSSVYPGAKETPYDGIDQDCSGGDLIDVDGDGHASTKAQGDDCDDGNVNTYPGASEAADGRDNDCDGLVDNHLDTSDDDKDGFAESQGDCNDNDASINPGAIEVPYDGLDQNCTGQDLTDVDGDDYAGGPTGGSQPDCNDRNPSVHPGMEETPYDGIDQDCDGQDLVDVDGDGVPGGPEGSDCDDRAAAVHPGASEVAYDHTDQDCDGKDLIDVDGDGQPSSVVGGPDCNDNDSTSFAGASEVPYDQVDQDCDGKDLIDIDHDGHPSTKAGGDDCDDNDATSHPGAIESLDGRDNDCNGLTDDHLDSSDDDADGYSELQGDCDDTNSSIHPTAVEIPYDSIDQDCSTADLRDVDGDGFDGGPDGNDCDDNVAGIHPKSTEAAYDGIDQDCDGQDLVDVDGDGQASILVKGGTDCDDQDARVHPGSPEVAYDGIDQDCTGQDLVDLDGDGFASRAVAGGTDCNDVDAKINPAAIELCNLEDDNCDGVVDSDAADRSSWLVDADHDGFGDPQQKVVTCFGSDGLIPDLDVLGLFDCDDSTAQVHPNAAELCNGRDDNCDNRVDDEDPTVTGQSFWYRDSDVDGFGNSASSIKTCFTPAGYVGDASDCDDSRSSANPAGQEVCDSVDNDCDSLVDDADSSVSGQSTWYRDADTDGEGTAAIPVVTCYRPAGFSATGTDCNDADAQVNVKAQEVCNGLDDNCNSKIDDADPGVTGQTTWYQDLDIDGFGDSSSATRACITPVGYVADSSDCDDSRSAVNLIAQEVCNGLDDDCNGQADDGDPGVAGQTSWFRDIDADGFGDPESSSLACAAPAGYVGDDTDCDDLLAEVNPVEIEVCNELDDNCDLLTDDADPTVADPLTWYFDGDLDNYGMEASSTRACVQPVGYAVSHTDCDDASSNVSPATPETCDGRDNNCDGRVDERCPFLNGAALVWGTGDANGGIPGIATWLMSSGRFSRVDYSTATHVSLETLKQYDMVLFFTNSSVGSDPGNGDVLADYADTGRRLVVSCFAQAGQPGSGIAGRYISGGYAPLESIGAPPYFTTTLGAVDNSTGFFDGVNSLSGAYYDQVKVATGATGYGSWASGMPLLARKGNVVGANLFPDDYFGNVEGDYQRFFVNALTMP